MKGLGPTEIDWTDEAVSRFEELVDPNTGARAYLEVTYCLLFIIYALSFMYKID